MTILRVLDQSALQALATRFAVQDVIAEWSLLPSVLDRCKLTEHFVGNQYIRELFIPGGVATGGKIHKYPCMNLLERGRRVTLVGDHLVEMVAPQWHETGIGHQRISFTLEDAIWKTYHDLPGAERMSQREREEHLTADTEEQFQAFIGLMTMDAPRCLS